MSGTFTILLNFSSATGYDPGAGVTPIDGVLYGTTAFGGASGDGALYSYDVATGAYRTLVTFSGTNGANPVSAVTDVGGILYGTTAQGGSSGDGTVFAYDLATGTERTLVNFGGNLGAGPSAGVVAVGGMLYGTTANGGSSNDGTVYAYDIATGTTRTLVNLNGSNGENFLAGVSYSSGVLYGITTYGGSSNDGTVYAYTIATGTLQTLVSFSGANGSTPFAGVTYGNGVLYGTTLLGGSSGLGTVYAYTIATGTLQTLINFNGTNGADPTAGVSDVNGNLYGITPAGGTPGTPGGGVLFDYNLATHTDQTLVNLGGNGDGQLGNLADIGNTLYGVTYQGGSSNGALFSYTLPCFAAGTRLATPAGEVDVASLRAGDTVTTALDGRAGEAEVTWVGHRDVDIARHPSPDSVRPVRVRAGAFGPGRPARDLLLSPDHALYLGGALIPVKYLIDGGTVAPDTGRTTMRYYHVALARHSVLLAEGLPAESFLATAGRSGFDADGTAVAPDAGFPLRAREAGACAPLEMTGPRVEAARRALRRYPVAA